MLFNLTTHTSFPCKDPSEAIRCRKDNGPLFGKKYFEDLSALSEPFNRENACGSWTNKDAYIIPRNSEGINMLTNQKCDLFRNLCLFTITEIEVWGVNFNE
jgi:hypothetical protein